MKFDYKKNYNLKNDKNYNLKNDKNNIHMVENALKLNF